MAESNSKTCLGVFSYAVRHKVKQGFTGYKCCVMWELKNHKNKVFESAFFQMRSVEALGCAQMH